jgi:tRNA(Arg) A34 adenosine deaminase TadA
MGGDFMLGQKFVYRAFQERAPTALADLTHMQLALAQAQAAFDAQEVPIGAVLTYQGQVVAQAHNHTHAAQNPCLHAELLAIQLACTALGRARLGPEAVLYVTLAPCLMCLGAILHARIGRVVLACAQSRFTDDLPTVLGVFESSPAWHPCVFEHGCMASASTALLQEFFAQRRPSREALLQTLQTLAHLPNVNAHTLALLHAQGFCTGADLLSPSLAHTLGVLQCLSVDCQQQGDAKQAAAVSYTHLTLPTT